MMNTAEIKLELFRKIDNLNDTELKNFYQAILLLLNNSEKYYLNSIEKSAIEEALENKETYANESILKEAQARYNNLKFK